MEMKVYMTARDSQAAAMTALFQGFNICSASKYNKNYITNQIITSTATKYMT
jgi:hypothetical protein